MTKRSAWWKAFLVALSNGAADAFREQLQLARELVVLPLAYDGLGGLAAVATVHGELERAARLYGASRAHRSGDPDDPVDVRLRVTFFEPARVRHGPAAWEAAAREGAALGFEDAIAFALERDEHGDPEQ